MRFGEASAVHGGPTTWTAEIAEGWDIMGVTNGGYLMSIVTRAMGAEASGRVLISSMGNYLNPVTPGPVDIVVQPLKQGRSLTTMRAMMSRDGRDLLQVTGVFADADRPVSEVTHRAGSPPDLPGPDECVTAVPATDAPFPPPFIGKIDLRIDPIDARALIGERSGEARVSGWFRLRDGEPLDANAVVLASDAMPPAIFNLDLPIGWTPTVDLAVQVRDPKPEGWLAVVFRTRFITDGLLEEDGEIWNQDGHLVGLSRQLALVPR